MENFPPMLFFPPIEKITIKNDCNFSIAAMEKSIKNDGNCFPSFLIDFLIVIFSIAAMEKINQK